MTDIKKLQEKLNRIKETSSRGEMAMITAQDLKEVCEIIVGESLDKPKIKTPAEKIINFFMCRGGFNSWWNNVQPYTRDELIKDLNALIETL